jgi:hypothetical protein
MRPREQHPNWNRIRELIVPSVQSAIDSTRGNARGVRLSSAANLGRNFLLIGSWCLSPAQQSAVERQTRRVVNSLGSGRFSVSRAHQLIGTNFFCFTITPRRPKRTT